MVPIVSADLTGPIDAERIPQTVCAMDSYRCVDFNKKLKFCWSLWAFFFLLIFVFFVCESNTILLCVPVFSSNVHLKNWEKDVIQMQSRNLPLKHFNKHSTRWTEKDVLPLFGWLYKTNLWVKFVQNSIYLKKKNKSKKTRTDFKQ